MAFVVRKIEQAKATFGEKLRALRRDRGLNVEQVAEQTHVHPGVIRALEADDFSRLPEPIYTRNFLKTYVRYLGGDEAYFLDCFEVSRGTCDFVDPLLLPRKRVRRARFLVTPRIFKFLSLGVAGCLVLAYLAYQVHSIVVPPKIELVEPYDGLSTEEAIVTVRGRVYEEARVLVNDKVILLNKDGSFAAEVDLDHGLNVITVEAKKRYSKTSTMYRRVVLEETALPDLSVGALPPSGEL